MIRVKYYIKEYKTIFTVLFILYSQNNNISLDFKFISFILAYTCSLK